MTIIAELLFLFHKVIFMRRMKYLYLLILSEADFTTVAASFYQNPLFGFEYIKVC